MRSDFQVVLDACVLAPPNVCDLLLTLAETPRLHLPRWSEDILQEVRRTQIQVLNFPEERADSWQEAVRSAFPEAMVEGYGEIAAVCKNDPKDRHVLAAAIKAGAEQIVTSNLRHFSPRHLDCWKIKAVDPASYCISLYTLDPGVVVSKLDEIARRRRMTPQELLSRYKRTIPAFSEHIAAELGWALP